MQIFVTVGMGRWPFDRLMRALVPLCDTYSIVAQNGTSSIVPPCQTFRFLSFPDCIEYIKKADCVITHAGNTVRLIQNYGKKPIVVAREKRYKEMGNDHQVDYLKLEESMGRVYALWDLAQLPDILAQCSNGSLDLKFDLSVDRSGIETFLVDTMETLCRKWIR